MYLQAMADNAVYKTALSSGELTVAAIDSAFDCFGDQVQNSSFAGIVAHGKFRSAIMRMDEFTKIDKTYAASGNGIVDDANCIGMWNGTRNIWSHMTLLLHMPFDRRSTQLSCGEKYIERRELLCSENQDLGC